MTRLGSALSTHVVPPIGGDLAGRLVVVVGLGASGIAAAELLLDKGARVVATDRAAFQPLPAALVSLLDRGGELVLGGHERAPFQKADLIVVSPGVPEFPELVAAERSGVPVIGETELASRFLHVPICAIGGTNGKSTVTTLMGHIILAAGCKTFVGGNLGRPACEAPREEGIDAAVLEVSSFQMERVESFRPRVAVLLGISEDHLDRYPSYADYVWAKGNCFAFQTSEDAAVVPAGDRICLEQAQRGGAEVVTFGDGGDYRLKDECVMEWETGELFCLSDVDLHGRHNLENGAAAIAAARSLGLGREAIEEGLRCFRALPHRMALAGCISGVTFYNDSKATNVGAAVTALRGATEPKSVVILGGRDKLGSYRALVEALASKGRAAVVLGEAAGRLEEAIGNVVPVWRVKTMREAVFRAFELARPGDCVLLSPACSSLDMYKNYSERGDRFIQAVLELEKTNKESHR